MKYKWHYRYVDTYIKYHKFQKIFPREYVPECGFIFNIYGKKFLSLVMARALIIWIVYNCRLLDVAKLRVTYSFYLLYSMRVEELAAFIQRWQLIILTVVEYGNFFFFFFDEWKNYLNPLHHRLIFCTGNISSSSTFCCQLLEKIVFFFKSFFIHLLLCAFVARS